jgi:predicted permease
VDWLSRDVRVGLRLLARDKAFTLTTALTLALCIGANTALFSIVHHVILRPLPVPQPERILHMSNNYPKAGAVDTSYSGVPDYFDRLRETTVFEEQALVRNTSVGLEQDGLPTRIRAQSVTPSYFRLLRVAPAVGRPFLEQEGEVGNDKKVLLSDALWQRQFGGDPGAVSRELRLDGQPHTVVGVLPRSVEAFAPGILLWRPLAFTPEERSDDNRHSNNYQNLGRLKAGASLEQAQAQIDALNAANLERFPQHKEILLNAGFHTRVERYPDRMVKSVKTTLYLLWGGAFFVLLIGCVNVANLVLVRTRVRLKELATRLALGAGPPQVARQLVVENLLLTLAAAAAGLALGALALRGLGAFNLQDLPYASDIRLDATAVLFTLGLSLTIGVVMGLLPVATVLSANITSILREEGRSASGGRGARALRRTLVVAEVAFTLVLLVGAGLLLASFRKVLAVDPGFVAERVATASVNLPRTRYDTDDKLRQFTDEALRRVRALPGVVAAGATDTIPFGGRQSDSVIFAEGYEMKPGESVLSPSSVDVTPGYFEAMGVKLVAGRFFQDSDGKDAPPAIMVDETLARRFWPNGDPIGRRMYRPTSIDNLTAVTEKTVFLNVVGVVRDVRLHDLTDSSRSVGTYYFPMAQDTSRLVTFALKTAGSPEAVQGALRTTLAELDRELPVFDAQTMEDRLDKSLLNRRSPAALSLVFGAVALLLSAVGLHGVLAYLVAQRRKEIGIRLALGSSSRGIFDLVLREGLRLMGVGVLLGGAGAFLLGRVFESQLFGVRATDPIVVTGATLLLGAVAFTACALPARRAARIDPKIALGE